jgi:hypothetical protein
MKIMVTVAYLVPKPEENDNPPSIPDGAEETNSNAVIIAQPMVEREFVERELVDKEELWGVPRWLVLLLAMFGALIIVVAVVPSVILSRNNNQDPPLKDSIQVITTIMRTFPRPSASPTQSPIPTSSPTRRPTVMPTKSPRPTSSPTRRRIDELQSPLLSVADLDKIALTTIGTAQFKALDWLANQDEARMDFEIVSTVELLERFVLALLFFPTDGDSWSNSAGFLGPTSVCNRTGVLCEPNVVELRWGANSLGGTIPTELGLLTSLRILVLRKSLFVMVSLTFITYFHFQKQTVSMKQKPYTNFPFLSITDGNSLTGTIPSELGRLTNLEDNFALRKCFGLLL